MQKRREFLRILELPRTFFPSFSRVGPHEMKNRVQYKKNHMFFFLFLHINSGDRTIHSEEGGTIP